MPLVSTHLSLLAVIFMLIVHLNKDLYLIKVYETIYKHELKKIYLTGSVLLGIGRNEQNIDMIGDELGFLLTELRLSRY